MIAASMPIYSRVLVLLALLGASTVSLAQDSEIKPLLNDALWIIEQYPPYHYKNGDRAQGLLIEVLDELFSRHNTGFDISKKALVFPWARAVKEVSGNANAVVISMTFTQERDRQFKLTRPIFNESFAIYGLTSRQLKLDNLSALSNLSIGAVRGDIAEKLLKQQLKQPLLFTYVQTAEELIKMLHKQRVDVIAYSSAIVGHQIKQAKLNKSEFQQLWVLGEMATTIAFNPEVDPRLFDFINEGILQLQKDGTVERIMGSD